LERTRGAGRNGGGWSFLFSDSFLGGRFIPRRRFAIISRASSLRVFFFMMKLLWVKCVAKQ
jgi:hypothetical protein